MIFSVPRDRKGATIHPTFLFQDLFSLYIALLLMYSLLVPLQIYANSLQKHPITRLLQVGLLSEFVALSATVFHHSLFAWNGKGIALMATFGDIMEIFSQV